MSLQIHVIPSGHSVSVPTPVPPSIDDLRIWIERTLQISVANQILLTNKGKHLRAQNFLVERELFLYDRAVFSASGAALHSVNLTPLPKPAVNDPFPTDLADQKSLKAWQTLFQQRRGWANDLLARCKSLQRSAEQLLAQRAMVEVGVRLATTSVEAPIKTIEKKLGDFRVGLEDTSKETMAKSKTLEENLKKIGNISAMASFNKFFVGQGMTGRTARKRSVDAMIPLGTLVDSNSARSAVQESRGMFSKFNIQINDFETSLKSLNQQLEETRRGLDIAHSRSISEDSKEPQRLIDEVKAVVAKVSSDCDKIAALRNEPTAISQASRAALYHTKNLLPSLQEYAGEMYELLRNAVELKNASVVRGADILQMVATVEAQQTNLREAVNALRMSDEHWAIVDRISIVSEIPLIYGSLLIEAIRRHEWIDKMRRDSANLAEEIAGYQEEESKRRKRWLRGMKDLVPDSMDGAVLGVEVNLQGEEAAWPSATRKDLDEYLQTLQNISEMSDTISYLGELVKDLDKPTRQQVKRVKAFKNGSVHEAGFGKGSLLLRGEDEGRVLKEVITKLEDELKSNKSRVRKLEDLLHRQSQISRLSIMNASPSQNTYQEAGYPPDYPERPPSVTSPRSPVIGSRRPSIASRRFSNQPVEDKSNIRRMIQLEAELAEEKASKIALKKELQSKEDEITTIWEELTAAKSTKKDIMDNMEARQKEFVGERKGLEDEISKFKFRVEEIEDELDRVIGSRETERANLDTRTEQLMTELEQTRRVGKDDVRTLERKLDVQLAEKKSRDAEVKDYLSGLFNALSPETAVPADFSDIMAALEEVTRRSIDQAGELKRTVAIIQSENENLQATSNTQRDEISSLTARVDSKEADIVQAKEEIASEKAKAESIVAQLTEERIHLKALRDKFADGETGSEELRLQLASQEGEVTRLSTELAQQKSHINGLDVALIASQSRCSTLQSTVKTVTNRLDDRGQRAKELTHRIYKQNERLLGLLESIGFAVTYENGSIVLQRASKVGGNSTTLPDQSTQLPSQEISISPAKKLLEDLSDLSSLLWMEKDSEASEGKKFTEFLAKIDKFNIDIFCDGVFKRMRDIEHTARKWQREARGYRDKARKHQSDAHDKIAYRSFKDGDLALFLPTRNQATRSWAAFNVGAPHYFLREQDSHRLGNKEWLIARITKVEERLVDLSKTMGSTRGVASTGDISEGGMSVDEDDNPFNLSDGLRWYLIDAQEEKPGAPSTPGAGKTTVAAANVDAKGSIPKSQKRPGDTNDVSRQLNKSLDSRRSSSNSKKSEYLAAALGIRRPLSNEAIEVDASGQSPGNRSFAPSHLRSTSQTSSLRQVKNSSAPEAEDLPNAPIEAPDEEEDGAKPGKEAGSSAAAASNGPTQSQSPTKSSVSPLKAGTNANADSPMKSPNKSNGRGRGSTWDSLWQFGVNFESGGQKN